MSGRFFFLLPSTPTIVAFGNDLRLAPGGRRFPQSPDPTYLRASDKKRLESRSLPTTAADGFRARFFLPVRGLDRRVLDVGARLMEEGSLQEGAAPGRERLRPGVS